ncbi:MAG: hypothetical protein EI684_19805 [Candidatus Viridilinea halotolerans]|uniref:FtsH ternary system domain-containing protein n=1 Tax=Candidatus Viridilinea halotolerans TaxID=2491704 RepID=A0A426TSH7_9CHLR|nr:MAG: hypothetical protein EI684_19805 [Candidatus Viridilinea halotolerans]
MTTRKPITIRFRFNQETGQIERFLIDDGDRTAPEAYHNQMAQAIAGRLFRRPQVADAGLEALPEIPSTLTPEEIRQREQ